MFCPNCGKEIEPANFCPHCGSTLPSIKEEPRPTANKYAVTPFNPKSNSQGNQLEPEAGAVPRPFDPSRQKTGNAQSGQQNNRKKTLILIGIIIGVVIIALLFAVGLNARSSSHDSPVDRTSTSSSTSSASADADSSSPFVREWSYYNAMGIYDYLDDLDEEDHITLVLHADGTGELTGNGEEESVTWIPNESKGAEYALLTWKSINFEAFTYDIGDESTLSLEDPESGDNIWFEAPVKAGSGSSSTSSSTKSSSTDSSSSSSSTNSSSIKSTGTLQNAERNAGGLMVLSGTIEMTTWSKRASEMGVSGFSSDSRQMALLVLDDGGVIGEAHAPGGPDTMTTKAIETISLRDPEKWAQYDGKHVTVLGDPNELWFPSDISGSLYSVSGACSFLYTD